MGNVVVVGGTGYAGGHIAREAASRGHSVVSYSRNLPEQADDGITYRVGSLTDSEAIRQMAAEADDLVISVPAEDLGDGRQLLDVLPQLAEAVTANDARLSFVGGAGSSQVSEGGPRLVDTPEFEEAWKPTALAHAAVLEALRQQPESLDWFYVSPAGTFGSWVPGEATGTYRTGGDVLVTKEDGSSEISGADFALAFVDEIEQRNHVRQRFTVGH